MRDNTLVCRAAQTVRDLSIAVKFTEEMPFAIHEGLASNRPTFGLCNFNANVRSFGPSRTGIVLRGSG
jgi:hypothetical protein